MSADLLKILTKRIRVRSLILIVLCTLYFCFSLYLFFQWIAPSLDGRTDQHIAADSSTYIYFADSLREGRNDPFVLASLSSFPNTLWLPVLLAFIFKSTFAMVIANYLMLLASVLLLKKVFTFSVNVFLGLLLINPTTTISLLSVNKEIVDLLVVSMFLYSFRSHRTGILIGSLLLAFLNRYGVCTVMLLFILAESKYNPWRRKRLLTLSILIVLLNFALPFFGYGELSARFEEARNGGAIAQLDSLEIHYLYALAVIPKIIEGIFGQIAFSPAKDYTLWFNNLANVALLFILAKKRLLIVRHDLVYFSMLGAVMMATSLVIQPRYFYFVYALLCLQVALVYDNESTEALYSGHSINRIADA